MKKLACIATLLLSQPFTMAAAPQFPPLASRFPEIGNGSAVFEIPKQSAIAIIGPITPEAIKIIRGMNSLKNMKTLYIDSEGGDVITAIQIADLLRESNARLVVNGRCFSACANYIFTGARYKDVLPGSLIGIHEERFQYYGEKKIHDVSARDRSTLINFAADPTIRDKVEIVTRLIHNFHAKVGISQKYFEDFDKYEFARAENIRRGNGSHACRKVDLWVLTRKDLEKMGVSGMGAIWSPGSIDEANSAAIGLGWKPEEIYFGTAEKLIKMCD